MTMRQARIRIRGKVQGVNFRSSTKAEAERLGLTGWVRNSPDGAVEALIEGPEETVGQLVDWCRRGPSWAQVDGLQVEWQEAGGAFARFEVRR